MTIYVTSDQHFGHAAARGFYRRPFASLPEMDAAMIAAWNSVVRADDEVWHLGDFAVKQPSSRVADLLASLHGAKHLVTGNNDDAAVHAASGWSSMQAYAELLINGTRLVLCHYPFRSWHDMAKGAVNLHGHSHGRLKPVPRQHDVGVDAQGLAPKPILSFLKRSKDRVASGPD